MYVSIHPQPATARHYGLTTDIYGLVYSMAQASRAIIPKDPNGPWGKRIGVTVGGSLSWALVVGAYVTGRVSSSDWLRYSLVVLNWYIACFAF